MDPFKQYKEDLKKRYDEVRLGTYASLLENPSQGKLRELCEIRCEEGKPIDLAIFRVFMGFPYDENHRQRFRQSREKFRSITNFLKDQTDLSDRTAADMLALLLDFENRPYRHYIQNHSVLPTAKRGETEDVKTFPAEVPLPRRSWKWIVAFLLLCVVGVIFYVYPLKGDCMQWKGDHYEVVDCHSEGTLVGYNENLMKLKKVEVDPNTVFFSNGQPQFWYCRHNGRMEFFNQPGRHPVTGRKLIPVSVQIAMKIRNKNKNPEPK